MTHTPPRFFAALALAALVCLPALAGAQLAPIDRPLPPESVPAAPPVVAPPFEDSGDDDLAVRRLILPPYYEELRGPSGLRTIFPLYFSRWSPDFSATLVGPYYTRTGPDAVRTRVLFPFYWSYERPGYDLLALPPFYTLSASNGWDAGIAPLFMAGAGRTGESHYVLIPPLLVADFQYERSGFTLVGPFYRRTKPESDAWGIVPLHFEGNTRGDVYDLWLPLYFRFADEEEGKSTTFVGPFYRRYGPGWKSFGLAPLIFRAGGQTEGGTEWSRLTVLPLFHTASRGDEAFRLFTPLFLYDDDEDSNLFVLPFYQRYRGELNVDSVAPLFWSWRRETTGSSSWLATLLFHSSGPAHESDVLFPFLWYLHDYDISRTIGVAPLFVHHYNWPERSRSLWLFPTIQYVTDPESWVFNIHPLLYLGASESNEHEVVFPFFWRFEDRTGPDTVLFPLYWDFQDIPERGRDIVGFPFFWHFRSGQNVTQVLLNSLYTQGQCERGEGDSWTFHFLPLFAFGEPCPGDTYWSVLYGLAGYRTAGRHKQMQLFWIPITLSSDE